MQAEPTLRALRDRPFELLLALESRARDVAAGQRDRVDQFVEPFESGLIAGAGIDIGQYVLLEGRYSHGLTDVNKIDDFIGFTNHGFSFTAGVRF